MRTSPAALGFLFHLVLFLFTEAALARSPSRAPERVFVLRVDALAQFALAEQKGASDGSRDSSTAIGPKLALNFGYAFHRTFRLGLYGTAQGAPVISGGKGFPSVTLDASFRWSVGPMATVRLGPRSPFELEAGLGFSHQVFVGSTDERGARPGASYEMGADFFGGEGAVHFLWRPGGAASPFGLMAGASLGWMKSSGTNVGATLVAPEVGLFVGF